MSVAIVSGAARGLGRAFSLGLADEGYQVLAFDRADEVLSLTDATGITGITGMVADVSKRADVERVAATAQELGKVRVLVNNAGTWRATPVDSDWHAAVADWDYIFDTNLRGVMMLSRAVIPLLQQAGGGDVVNVSTYYVLPAKTSGTNNPETDLYNASKWALNGFTDAWAKYLAKDNIKVNGMCMGATDTPMLRGLFADNVLPDALAAEVMQPQQLATQLVDIINSDRSGENFGAWVGEKIGLGEQPPLHRRITG